MSVTEATEVWPVSFPSIPLVKISHLAKTNIDSVEKCLLIGMRCKTCNKGLEMHQLLAELSVIVCWTIPKLSGIKQQFIFSLHAVS